MKIHRPVAGDDETVRIDVGAGAVTFDPWPFGEESVGFNSLIYYFSRNGRAHTGTLHLLAKDDDNTLVTLTNGCTAVCAEQTWLDAVEAHGGTA